MKHSYKVVPLVLMMIALVSCYRDDIINRDENSAQDPLTKAREILERDEVVKMLPAPEKMFKVTADDAADLARRYSNLFADGNSGSIHTNIIFRRSRPDQDRGRRGFCNPTQGLYALALFRRTAGRHSYAHCKLCR